MKKRAVICCVFLSGATCLGVSLRLSKPAKKIKELSEKARAALCPPADKNFTNILKKLDAKTSQEALKRIDQLKKQAESKEMPPSMAASSTSQQERELLSLLNAQNLREAKNKVELLQATVNQLDDFIQETESSSFEEAIGKIESLTEKRIKQIMLTVANALNAPQAKQLIEASELDQQAIKKINQSLYDHIFELKKRYFETTQLFKQWAEPLISSLQDLTVAKQTALSELKSGKKPAKNILEAVLNDIPDRIPATPRLEDTPRKQLIEKIQLLEVTL